MDNFGVIICTYERPVWVKGLLRTINKSSILPKRVVIVDSSPIDYNYAVDATYELRIVRDAVTELTYQRRNGIAYCADLDYVFMLDDDLEVTQQFFELIIKAFKDHENVGAISGYISNEWGVSPSIVQKLSLRLMSLFGIYSGTGKPGSVSKEGIFVELNQLVPFSGLVETDFVPGGATCYRKIVFDNYLPPLEIKGYGPEDKAFSRIIAPMWKLMVLGEALCIHHSAPGGARPTIIKKRITTVRNFLMLNRNYIQKTGNIPLKTYFVLNGLFSFAIGIVLLIYKPRKAYIWIQVSLGYILGVLLSNSTNE